MILAPGERKIEVWRVNIAEVQSIDMKTNYRNILCGFDNKGRCEERAEAKKATNSIAGDLSCGGEIYIPRFDTGEWGELGKTGIKVTALCPGVYIDGYCRLIKADFGGRCYMSKINSIMFF